MRGRLTGLGVAAWALNCLAIVNAANAQTPPAEQTTKIDQGWSDQQKANWYTTSQGSRLLPLDWLLALEQPGSNQKKFLDPEHIKSFRYLPDAAPAKSKLPVGFAIDDQDDGDFSHTKLRWKQGQKENEKWVGMNCAACHTAEITYTKREGAIESTKRMRIEGGPTLADFQSFIDALNQALRETKSSPDKTKRFAEVVLKGPNENTPANRAMLDRALSQLIERQAKVEKANAIPEKFYGFGRLDAFGHIFNKVALAVQKEGVPQTFHSSNAPVSYPFLWNIHQHDKVQWNGIANNQRIRNLDVGALGRNIGEVTGVFADVSWFEPENSTPSITSSAEAENLSKLEQQLTLLRPPMWPTGVLGAIDDTKRDRGRELFIDENRKTADGKPIQACSECHKGLPRNNLGLPIKAQMIPLKEIGTDIWMACNAVAHDASTGVLLNSPKPGGGRYLEKAPVAALLTTVVTDTIIENIDVVIRGISAPFSSRKTQGLGSKEDANTPVPAGQRPIRTTDKKELANQCLNGTDPLLAYKARPLTGIWATAPYLHNGSVPTLYDLLLPAEERPTKFVVGTREFDTVRVGYVTRDAAGKLLETPTGDNGFVFNARDAAGRMIDGNSNAGHDYGNGVLTDDERWALVEYMKGL